MTCSRACKFYNNFAYGYPTFFRTTHKLCICAVYPVSEYDHDLCFKCCSKYPNSKEIEYHHKECPKLQNTDYSNVLFDIENDNYRDMFKYMYCSTCGELNWKGFYDKKGCFRPSKKYCCCQWARLLPRAQNLH